MQKDITATVKDFIDAAAKKTALEVVTGGIGLNRVIHEPAIHRPGLALAGFLEHFAFRRIQVLGLAEMEYLASMSARNRHLSLLRVFAHHIPCIVVCRNRKIHPEMINLAQKFKIAILRSPMITGKFVNSATLIMESLVAPHANMQGTMLDIMGIGVLIEGKPGIGKSEAALVLITRKYTLVADDFAIVRRVAPRTILVSSSPLTRYHLELRGIGIIHIPSLFGVASVRNEKELDLIITLKRADQFSDGRVDIPEQKRDIFGVQIPNLVIPVAPGRDLASLIEVAAFNEKLKRLGHDAAKELDEKIKTVLSAKARH